MSRGLVGGTVNVFCAKQQQQQQQPSSLCPLQRMTWFLLFRHCLSPHNTVSPSGNLHTQYQPSTRKCSVQHWQTASLEQTSWTHHYHGVELGQQGKDLTKFQQFIIIVITKKGGRLGEIQERYYYSSLCSIICKIWLYFTTITDRVMQNPERFFCTMIWAKSPHNHFLALTYVWSWDFIEIFLQGKAIREVCQGHPGGTSQNITEVQNLSQTVTQSAAILAGRMTCFAFRLYNTLSCFCAFYSARNSCSRVQ